MSIMDPRAVGNDYGRGEIDYESLILNMTIPISIEDSILDNNYLYTTLSSDRRAYDHYYYIQHREHLLAYKKERYYLKRYNKWKGR